MKKAASAGAEEADGMKKAASAGAEEADGMEKAERVRKEEADGMKKAERTGEKPAAAARGAQRAPRTAWTVAPGSPLPRAAAVMMALAALIRLGYYFLLHGGEVRTAGFLLAQVALPVVCCAAMCALCLRLDARKLPWTAAPVLLGCLFFALKALGFPSALHTALCLLLYLGVAAFYALTVWGCVGTKVPLVLIFALPLAYHILVEDLLTALRRGWAAEADRLLLESTVLLIMAALLCVSLALKKTPAAKTGAPA